jgi:hypothetical protein
MAGISFSDKPEETWVVAGWAFRQVLEDVASTYPDDGCRNFSVRSPVYR